MFIWWWVASSSSLSYFICTSWESIRSLPLRNNALWPLSYACRICALAISFDSWSCWILSSAIYRRCCVVIDGPGVFDKQLSHWARKYVCFNDAMFSASFRAQSVKMFYNLGCLPNGVQSSWLIVGNEKGRGPDGCRPWRFQLRFIMSDLTSQIYVLVHISFLESEISLSISSKSRHIWSWLLLTSIAVGGWQTQKLLYIEQMINKISFQHSFCKINMLMYVNTNPQSR